MNMFYLAAVALNQYCKMFFFIFSINSCLVSCVFPFQHVYFPVPMPLQLRIAAFVTRMKHEMQNISSKDTTRTKQEHFSVDIQIMRALIS